MAENDVLPDELRDCVPLPLYDDDKVALAQPLEDKEVCPVGDTVLEMVKDNEPEELELTL